ncbi:LysM peptidoglycan-binding domain-containing protein [Bacillus thermotolerans]|uniref:LysM peptidoglycan-binding domain-containing protein n=1 Tax=Bacillus thermotolerans TaxID=1221996 RepID=UPI00057EA671|nr:LysM peptidoglycan-binding domain-containing protein [Bacillus thermotolerans]KKB33634.1 Spore cortex-lytic enzyme, N-acetylglucosaminidase SleL [Bacillus thermotolerans]
MQIHVVQRGQTLYGIAQLYQTSVQSIAAANELPDPSRLVVGQALVIPITGSYHWVQPGESLFSIARIYGMSANELARINNISAAAPLQAGMRLYIPPRPKPTIDVFLYVEPRDPISETMVNEVRDRASDLTYLAMFSYEVRRDGSMTTPPIGNLPDIARAAGAMNAMVISNIEEFQFSADLARAIFTNEAAQNQLFGNAIQIANEVGYEDIHFDFELMHPEDRELYNTFLRRARDRFHAAGLTLSNAVAPKPSDVMTGIYGAHDYETIGELVDFTALMTYEWGFTYSDPQAVSPIGPVRDVVEYAVSVIPRNKILLGQNLYGYDWQAPYPPAGGPPARVVSPQQAIELALRENAQIEYDPQAQAPFFRYIDNAGRQHEVWFEDARSIQAKFNLIKQFNLRGIMYWKLGLSFPQNWLLLRDNFNIRKRE